MTARTRFIVKVAVLSLACIVFIGTVITLHVWEHAEPEPLVININTATAEEFSQLYNITDETIANILAYRNHFFRFSSVDVLLEVEGVTEELLYHWRPHLTV